MQAPMTHLPDPLKLGEVLADRFGLSLVATPGRTQDGTHVDLCPTDVHTNEGFFIRTHLGWRHIRAELHVGNFARDLLREMSAANSEQHARFVALQNLLCGSGGQIAMTVNRGVVSAAVPESWPSQWDSVGLSVERTPLMVDHESPESLEQLILFWGGNLFGMVVSLLPLEELELGESMEPAGLPEGARERIEVNRYERNRINRTLCIAIHGTSCLVCGFDFVKVYGELGRDFIHVHHVVPVSKLGAGYVIDPAMDLVPVCPNCHAMLHRRDPPLSVAEVREQVKEYRLK